MSHHEKRCPPKKKSFVVFVNFEKMLPNPKINKKYKIIIHPSKDVPAKANPNIVRSPMYD
jgi:hypothetical protein